MIDNMKIVIGVSTNTSQIRRKSQVSSYKLIHELYTIRYNVNFRTQILRIRNFLTRTRSSNDKFVYVVVQSNRGIVSSENAH